MKKGVEMGKVYLLSDYRSNISSDPLKGHSCTSHAEEMMLLDNIRTSLMRNLPHIVLNSKIEKDPDGILFLCLDVKGKEESVRLNINQLRANVGDLLKENS